MVRIGEVVNSSMEWAQTVLFRPFCLKKWLILGFVALLAGAMTGSRMNLNLPGGSEPEKTAQSDTAKDAEARKAAPAQEKQLSAEELWQKAAAQLKNPVFIAILIISCLALLALSILFTWLHSRFIFVFLQDIVNNDASVKAPFRENKPLGNSLFKFYLCFQALSLFFILVPVGACLYKLAKAGVFVDPAKVGAVKIILICLPHIFIFLIVIFILGLIGLLVRDFVAQVMFKEKIKFLPAWAKAWAILIADKFSLLKYLLVKFALGLVANIAFGLLSMMAMISALLPIGLIAGLFYFIYRVTPVFLRIPYFVILGVVAAAVFFILICCGLALYLPCAVFFRAFSVKFFARLSPGHDLLKFTSKTEG